MKQTMYHFRNPPTGYTPLNVLLVGGSHLARWRTVPSVLPNLMMAASSHLPRWRTAQGYQSTRRLRQVPKLKVRLCLTKGFCPHFGGCYT